MNQPFYQTVYTITNPVATMLVNASENSASTSLSRRAARIALRVRCAMKIIYVQSRKNSADKASMSSAMVPAPEP
jgi:K+-sensing histidine kinase KdpD